MKRFLVAFVFLLLGLWFLKLWLAGDLAFYILPRFNILVSISGILFCALSLFLLWSIRTKSTFFIPFERLEIIGFSFLFFLAFFIPPRPLSSASVLQRGINTDLSHITLRSPVQFNIDSSQRTFSDWVHIIGSSDYPHQYENEPVRMKGFVYRDDTVLGSDFYIARFLIRCCSADARPVVFRVRSSDNSIQIPSDTWISLSGTFLLDDTLSQPLFIQMEDFEIIPVPDIPYIY